MYDKTKETLSQSLNSLAPDMRDKIMQAEPVRIETEEELLGRPKTMRKRTAPAFAAAAAVLLVCIVSGYLFDMNRVTDEIYLDVNPSISIALCKDGHISHVTGVNEDGQRVVGSIADELKEASNPAAVVSAVMREIKEEGYFQDDEADMLVSLEYNDKSKEGLLDPIADAVQEYAESAEMESVLIMQSFKRDDAVGKEAKNRNLSSGKYVFLKKMADNNEESLESLSEKSLDEIEDCVEARKLKFTDDMTVITTVPSGKGKARKAAEEEKTDAAKEAPKNDEAVEEEASDVAEEAAPEAEVKSDPEKGVETPAEEKKDADDKGGSNDTKVAKPKVSTENSTENSTASSTQKAADVPVSISSVSFSSKGKAIIKFSKRAYFGKSLSVAVEDTQGNKLPVSIKKASSKKIAVKVAGLADGKTYNVTVQGVKENKKGKITELQATFVAVVGSKEVKGEAASENSDTSKKENSKNKSSKGSDNNAKQSQSDSNSKDAEASVSINSVSSNEKGKIVLKFAARTYYGSCISVALEDGSGNKVPVVIKKAKSSKMTFFAKGLSEGETYYLTVHGVKAAKNAKTASAQIAFTHGAS